MELVELVDKTDMAHQEFQDQFLQQDLFLEQQELLLEQLHLAHQALQVQLDHHINHTALTAENDLHIQFYI